MPARLLAGLLLPASLTPGPGTARGWVERELGHADYRQSLLQRFSAWLGRLWDSLQQSASAPTSVSDVVAVVVLVLALLFLATRVRREPRSARLADGLLGPAQVSAQQHRDAAEAALGRGDHAGAVVAAFRALATRSADRGLLAERPGLTAHELAGDLTGAFPDAADDLARASLRFDLVFYGGLPATEEDARGVLDLDDRLRAARPARTPSGHGDPVPAVPR